MKEADFTGTFITRLKVQGSLNHHRKTLKISMIFRHCKHMFTMI